MIVRRLQEANKTDRRIVSNGWESTRLLLKDDQVGYSFHITTIYRDAELHFEYKNHLEAVYCISGEGEIVDKATNTTHPITAGTLYVLDQHDKHILRGFSEMSLACVFNPPLNGKEVHQADGSYSLEADTVSGQ